MHGLLHIVRAVVVLMIGLPLLTIGIILIPLPGPGFLLTFVALFILSLEFSWARRLLEPIKRTLKKLIARARIKSEERSKRFETKDKQW